MFLPVYAGCAKREKLIFNQWLPFINERVNKDRALLLPLSHTNPIKS